MELCDWPEPKAVALLFIGRSTPNGIVETARGMGLCGGRFALPSCPKIAGASRSAGADLAEAEPRQHRVFDFPHLFYGKIA